MKRRVVKLGGSLFELSSISELLARWLDSNSDMQNILIVGGGRVADLVRENSEALSNEKSHEIACGAMRFTAKLISHIVNQCDPCKDLTELNGVLEPNIVFDSYDWILAQPNVPASWDFTSDSIAARLAASIDADELVLIKSRMGDIDEPGFVDACFAEESKSVKSIQVCTLSE